MDNREFKLKLEKRTKTFAIAIVRFCIYLRKLNLPEALIIQLLKAETAIGSNYREARAESKNDFIHKIGIVELISKCEKTIVAGISLVGVHNFSVS